MDDFVSRVLLLSTVASAQRNSTYRVEVVERVLGPDGGSILSYENATSDFKYTFAPAYFPPPEDGSGPDGLLLRVQRAAQVGAHSGIAVVRRVGAPHSMTFEKADDSKLIIRCPGINGITTAVPTAAEPCADDPRIVYRHADKRYYMTYDNNSNLEYSPRVTWIASSPTPWVVDSWIFHGPLWPVHTAGASILLRDDVPPPAGSPPPVHYAFIGTSDAAGSLFVSESTDMLNWHTNTTAWQQGRPFDTWDWRGLAAGPPPVRLSDGNYLYLYSIDNLWSCQSASCNVCNLNCSDPQILSTCPNCNDGRCALGWMILDGKDPLSVLQKADAPLLKAELEWETTGSKAHPVQTPWVIFTDGLQQVGLNEFIVYYGGGDTNVGASRIKVTVPF